MHEYQGQQIVRRSWARRTGFTLAWLFLLAAAAAAVIATSEPVQAARDPPLAPRAEPHRPAARRGRAVHRQVPGTGGPAALGDRGRQSQSDHDTVIRPGPTRARWRSGPGDTHHAGRRIPRHG
jgi:hypothetical protein